MSPDERDAQADANDFALGVTKDQANDAAEDAKKHPVCYVLVRADLPKTRQAIDVGHAAQECVRRAPVDKRTALRVLWVRDEAELRQFAEKLSAKKYNHDVVYEPDAPYSGQAMSLGVEPLTERLSGLGRLFYHLERMDLDGPPPVQHVAGVPGFAPCTRAWPHSGPCAHPELPK